MQKSTILIIAVVIVCLGVVGYAAKALYFGNSVPSSNNVQITGDAQVVKLSFSQYNYNPSTITVKSGMPVKIVADMSNIRGCYRDFQIPALGINKAFSESDNTLTFTPTKPGTYSFRCIMGMGTGTLVVQ